MTWYFVIAGVLFVLALIESLFVGSRIPGVVAAFILIFFVGLRHETGNDWLEYERYFDLVPTIWGEDLNNIPPDIQFEPIYVLLNMLIKSAGLGTFTLFLLVAILNVSVIYVFVGRQTDRIALVFLWAYGLTFLPGQMATVRQGAAYSFILLAVLAQRERRLALSMAYCGLAASMHLFALVFIPLLYLELPRPSLQPIYAAAAAGLGMSFIGFHLFPFIASTLATYLPNLAGDKVLQYGTLEAYQISVSSLLMVLWHSVALYLLWRAWTVNQSTNIFIRFAFYSTLLTIFAHCFLGTIPVFWNRLMLIAFIAQAAALCARYATSLNQLGTGLAVCSGVALVACGALYIVLAQPTSLAYTPYQNVIVSILTGDPGDGRLRYQIQAEETNRILRERGLR